MITSKEGSKEETFFSSEKNMMARLKFAREDVDKDLDIWNNVL